MNPKEIVIKKLIQDLNILSSCPICKEFFKAPLRILGCNHVFCSYCLRSACKSTMKCPICNKLFDSFQESNNRGCIRESLLETIADIVSKISELSDNQESKAFESADTQQAKISKLSDNQDSKGRTTKLLDSRASKMVDRASQTEFHGEITLNASNGPMISVIDNASVVKCPICGLGVKESKINHHIDSGCTSHNWEQNLQHEATIKAQFSNSSKGASNVRGRKRRTTTRSMAINLESNCHISKKRTRQDADDYEPSGSDEEEVVMIDELPKIPSFKKALAYNLLNQKQLKEKLLQDGVPIHGDKSQMIKRYDHYRLLCNSNLDSKFPRSGRELLKDLEEWEETLQSASNSVGSKDLETQTKAHLEKHADEFSKMIQHLKSRKNQKENTAANNKT